MIVLLEVVRRKKGLITKGVVASDDFNTQLEYAKIIRSGMCPEYEHQHVNGMHELSCADKTKRLQCEKCGKKFQGTGICVFHGYME